jgi:hypothetical protein
MLWPPPDVPQSARDEAVERAQAGEHITKAEAKRMVERAEKVADSGAVAALLHCTGRWRTELTEQARTVAGAARDAAILAGKDEGKSNHEIAWDVGVPRATVVRVVNGGPNPPQGENGPPTTPVLLPDHPA